MLANLLTLSRLVFAAGFAVVVAAFVHMGEVTFWPGIAAIVVGLMVDVTDVFDGIVARRMGIASQFGGILDPLADSLGRLTVYFALGLSGSIPIVVPLVMTGRDIIVGYTRVIQAATGGKTSARMSGKFKAVIQGGGVPLIVALAWAARYWPAGTISVLRWIVAAAVIAVTLWSLADYLRAVVPSVRKM